MDTKIFRDLSYGVYITTTLDGQRPTGCITNSVMQITSSPATLAVSVNHDNFTNGCIAKTGKFTVSILPENTDPVLIGAFGFQSGKDKDKFAGVDYELAEGIPVVKASMGYMVCKVISTMETSTHTVFLGEVIAAEVYERTAPAMTYAYYHAVLKGKSPKNAPTYQPPEEESKPKASSGGFVCQVCGYVYEGEDLPTGFTCPVCGVSRENFKPRKPLSKFMCQVCGYVYEGEELPAGFTCPVCGVGRENFKQIS